MNIKEELKRGISCDSIANATTVTQRVVCLAAHPGRMALYPLLRWYESRYQGKYKFARLAFFFDLILVGILLGLCLVALVFVLWKPSSPEYDIRFEASVAPTEIISGAPSTLVIRYENKTGMELRDARLTLAFPEDFLLQEGERIMEIGTVPIDGSGSIKVRGVMFGDVGGPQRFESVLTFLYGDHNETGSKYDQYEFVPARSTLALDLSLPEKLMASQTVNGELRYTNTGEIDISEVRVEPRWPDGFSLVSSDVPFANGSFSLSDVKAGTEGTLRFSGTLGSTDGMASFVFHPSFVFGQNAYQQETLTRDVQIVPVPLSLSHSVNADTIRPGGVARVTITYANVGSETLTDVKVGVESASPFARVKSVTASSADEPALAAVEPGETGTVTLELPLYSSISQSATSVYENIPFVTHAFGSFDTTDANDLAARDAREITHTMTSPIALDAFARYAAPSGDQIGRGPLPPAVGETTKYWVFLNLRGTTNVLANVRVEGELGSNVSFTGRQTVSTNDEAMFDAATNQIIWTADSISPTFSPSSKVVGIAFELAITPSADQLSTIPTLLKNIRVTGTDATTGAFVSAAGADITTNLPNDSMAAGHGTVE